MKSKLLASLIALCGLTSFAVDPVAVWSGDFNETTKGNYTLSANGNTVAEDGSSITISTTATKGVLVDISPASTTGKTTLIVKYSGLSTPSSNAVLLSGAMNSQIKDLVGVAVKSDGSISNIWDNNVDSRGSVDSSVAVPQTGIVVFTYDGNNSTASSNKGGAFYVKTASGMARKAQSLGSLFSTGNPVNGFAIGGKRASGSLGVIPGLVIEGIAIFDSVLSTTDMAAYEFPKVAKKNESVLLLNFGKSNPTGWVTCNEMSVGGNIPQTGTLSQEGSSATFRIAGGGNFFNEDNKDFDLVTNGTFSNGTYRGTDGKDYETIEAEVKASLGLADNVAFDSSVYGCGLQNGGFADHTATIGGLDATAKYIVYVGYGMHKSNQCAGFKITSDQCSSVDSIDYVTTVAGTGTSVASAYTAATVGTELRPGENGLLIVRLTNVVPTSSGEIKFAPHGERSGINFLAVAKVNETVTYTTAEIDGGAEISVSAINEALTETNDKAEVTLTAGATVYVDETPAVPTKFICEGAITISATEKPDLSRFDLSGVTGGIVRTWLVEAEKKGIGFNFAKGCGPNTTQARVETVWYDNAKENNGTNKAFSSDGLTTITYTSKNTYNDSGNNNDDANGTLVKGYLDDGNGDGVQITVKNVPFAEYAVIIYASTDQGGKMLSFKKVNGKSYTYDSANSEVAKVGEDAWGACQSSSKVEYGRNVIRVVAQSSGTLTIESKRDDSKNVRGCISAIQIVPYSSFVAPTAKIASVEAKCSTDYTSNTITGTIADYVANSWTGDVTARVVVNSTVYESEAIKDNAFTIEVTGLDRETVYRTVLEIGYTDGETFNSIKTQPVALYQGEQKFVWTEEGEWINETATTKNSTGTWTDGITISGDKLVVNAANGVTFTPKANPDYVEKCDSTFTVSISASEAVDAASDPDPADDVQGGVRITSVGGVLKVQVLADSAWTDLKSSGVDIGKDYEVVVAFHYAKEGVEGDADSVSYTLDGVTVTGGKVANTVAKISSVEVADGTSLAFLKGNCQLDKAVVADVEIVIDHDETAAIEAENIDAAQAIADKMVVAISEEVAKVVEAETYRGYFKVVAKQGTDGKFHAVVEFAQSVKDEIEDDIEEAMEKVVDAFNAVDGKAEIDAKPGLYYGVKRGASPDKLDVEETTLATSEKVTITITKPDNASKHFYRIICSPTPASNK